MHAHTLEHTHAHGLAGEKMEMTEWEKRRHVVPVWSDVSHYRKSTFPFE